MKRMRLLMAVVAFAAARWSAPIISVIAVTEQFVFPVGLSGW